jgi:hypothetical protein
MRSDCGHLSLWLECLVGSKGDIPVGFDAERTFDNLLLNATFCI